MTRGVAVGSGPVVAVGSGGAAGIIAVDIGVGTTVGAEGVGIGVAVGIAASIGGAGSGVASVEEWAWRSEQGSATSVGNGVDVGMGVTVGGMTSDRTGVATGNLLPPAQAHSAPGGPWRWPRRLRGDRCRDRARPR